MFAGLLLAASLNCMAEAMFYEARSEGYEGMITVGAVIHNRVLDPRWSDGVCAVIDEPSQFSYLPAGREAGTMNPPDNEAYKRAEQAAYSVLSASDGNTPLLNNILYYHADYALPSWDFDLLHHSFTLGSHLFYEDKDNDFRE